MNDELETRVRHMVPVEATRHVIAATIPVLFTFSGLAEGERERANVKAEVTYSYFRGALTMANDREPAELTLIGAKLLDADGLHPSHAEMREWAQNWLDDEGYDAACQHAERTP